MSIALSFNSRVGNPFAETNDFSKFTEADKTTNRNTALSRQVRDQEQEQAENKRKKDDDLKVNLQAVLDQMNPETRDFYNSLGHDLDALRVKMQQNRKELNEAKGREIAAYDFMALVASGEYDPDNSVHADLVKRAGLDKNKIDQQTPDEQIRSGSDAAEDARADQERLEAEYAPMQTEYDFKAKLRDDLENDEITLEQAKQLLESRGYKINHAPDGDIVIKDDLIKGLKKDSASQQVAEFRQSEAPDFGNDF